MNSSIRVLVPLDGSDMAGAALSYITTLRGLGPLHVRLVAVAEDGRRYGVPNAGEWQDRQANLLKEYLSAREKQLKEQSKDIEVETAVRLGDPADALMKDASQYGAGYIIISTHGRSGIERWRLGSVADKVIRASDWNTLVVGPQPATWPMHYHVRSIMVPLDGSSRAETAIPVASALAQELGAQIHLVRVVERPLWLQDVTGLLLESAESDAQEYLVRKAAELNELAPHTFVLDGAVADALRAYVQVQAMDLVVMTSHGSGGLVRSTLGSVADRLIGGAAPVLIIRSRS